MHLGVVIALLLLPAWGKLPDAPPPFSAEYVTGFALFWVMLFTVAWWVLTGCKGLSRIISSPALALWGIALIALTVWGYASTAWAYEALDHPSVAQNGALQLGIATAFALAAASSKISPRVVVTALLLGIVWTSAIVILQAAAQSSIGLSLLGEFKLSPTQAGVSVLEAGELRWLRPYALTSHPNVIAGFLALSLPACAVWILSKDRRLGWVGTAVFLLGLFALLLTFSRGAWLGFAAGALALLPLVWWRARQPIFRRHVALTLILTLLLGVVFLWTFRPLVQARTGLGLENTEQRSLADRVVYTEIAYRAVLGDYAHPRTRLTMHPLLGLGLGNFPWYAADFLFFQRPQYDLRGDNVHHILLLALTEVGIIGFGCVIVALCAGVQGSLTAIKQAKQLGDTTTTFARAALLSGVIVLLISGMFDHYGWSMLHFQMAWWVLLGVAAAPPPNNSIPSSARE